MHLHNQDRCAAFRQFATSHSVETHHHHEDAYTNEAASDFPFENQSPLLKSTLLNKVFMHHHTLFPTTSVPALLSKRSISRNWRDGSTQDCFSKSLRNKRYGFQALQKIAYPPGPRRASRSLSKPPISRSPRIRPSATPRIMRKPRLPPKRRISVLKNQPRKMENSILLA